MANMPEQKRILQKLLLAKRFEKNSSSKNYSNEFQQHKCKAEKEHINFTSTNDKDYNSLFFIDDLIYSIKTAKDIAAGPDEINYQFHKHLPAQSLVLLLQIFNKIWVPGNVPNTWKNMLVIPIPKP
jgi:hypothetical protein